MQPKEPIRVDSSDEQEEEEEKPQLPPNMKSTLKPIDMSNSVTPMSEDNDSNFPPPDEDSQPVYGPSKEENTKLGFGGLKLGLTFIVLMNCDKLAHWEKPDCKCINFQRPLI